MKSIKKLSLATALLFSVSHIFGITKATDPVAKTVAKNKAVVVIFTMPDCGPCKKVKPLFNQLKSYNKNVVYLEITINGSNAAYYRSAYGVTSAPTIVYFKNGKKQTMHVGAGVTLAQMRAIVNNLVR